MKKIILILILIYISFSGYSQDTIVTAKGDEYSYYLTGNSWSQFKTSKTKLSIKVYVSNEGNRSVWLQNLSLKETVFNKLMGYVDTLPHIAIGARTYYNHILDSFEIYFNDNTNIDYMPMNKENNKNLNLVRIQEKIKAFFTKE